LIVAVNVLAVSFFTAGLTVSLVFVVALLTATLVPPVLPEKLVSPEYTPETEYGDADASSWPAVTLHTAFPPLTLAVLPFLQDTVLALLPVMVKTTVPLGVWALVVTGVTWASRVTAPPVVVLAGLAVTVVVVPAEPVAPATMGMTANDVTAIRTPAPAAAATCLARPLNIFPPPDDARGAKAASAKCERS
jgi:hypothetical protein